MSSRWVAKSPVNALIWFVGTAFLGLALTTWRVTGARSEVAFFGYGRATGMTVIAVLLIGMSLVYGLRAYRAIRAGTHA